MLGFYTLHTGFFYYTKAILMKRNTKKMHQQLLQLPAII